MSEYSLNDESAERHHRKSDPRGGPNRLSRARDPRAFALFTAEVTSLARATRLVLGVRRRFYRHRAPAGWRATSAGYRTTYHSPDDRACIEVAPALPAEEMSDEIDLGAAAPGTEVDRREGPLLIGTGAGLSGNLYRAILRQDGLLIHRDVAVLRDRRYSYSVQLDAMDPGLHQDTFRKLVASVEVLPVPRTFRDPAAGSDAVFDHWC